MDTSRLSDLSHRLLPVHRLPSVETVGPSPLLSRTDLASDESTKAHRTTALRQLNGNSRPLSRWPRQGNSTNSQLSALAPQPILPRSYSGHAGGARESPRMHPRGSDSREDRFSVVELPAPEDFSIESILRAIETDICGTLDSIAEICGRSRLSLANEYGSHIAPLGEICESSGGLLTVDEISARDLGDNVVIYDDENSITDDRELELSRHTYFRTTRRAIAGNVSNRVTQISLRETPLVHEPPGWGLGGTSRPLDPNAERYSLSMSRRVSSRLKPCALLGKRTESVDRHQSIQTPAVVSEVRINARASTSSLLPAQRRPPQDKTGKLDHGSSFHPALHALFAWFRYAPGVEPNRQQTAEMLLREMLQRQGDQNVTTV